MNLLFLHTINHTTLVSSITIISLYLSKITTNGEEGSTIATHMAVMFI
uniref:Uncharacterized protein n=1 Tax=Rhizophora mucronata TaxID=61149 RepID=A0A2P2JDZ6_RHIMU